jgi:hypothetical protein
LGEFVAVLTMIALAGIIGAALSRGIPKWDRRAHSSGPNEVIE